MFITQSRDFDNRRVAATPEARSAAQRVIGLIARERNVPESLLVNPSRCRASIARERQLAMYLTHTLFGETLAKVGSAFNRDRTTVSYACALIEDLREDNEFDREVARLETLLSGSTHA